MCVNAVNGCSEKPWAACIPRRLLRKQLFPQSPSLHRAGGGGRALSCGSEVCYHGRLGLWKPALRGEGKVRPQEELLVGPVRERGALRKPACRGPSLEFELCCMNRGKEGDNG